MNYIEQFFEKFFTWLRDGNINIDGIIAWIKNVNILGFIGSLFSVSTVFALVVLFVLGKASAKIIKICGIIIGVAFILWMASYFFPEFPNIFEVLKL